MKPLTTEISKSVATSRGRGGASPINTTNAPSTKPNVDWAVGGLVAVDMTTHDATRTLQASIASNDVLPEVRGTDPQPTQVSSSTPAGLFGCTLFPADVMMVAV